MVAAGVLPGEVCCWQVQALVARSAADCDPYPPPGDPHSLLPLADKNPILTEFATEVTKFINEAVAEAEAAAPDSQR